MRTARLLLVAIVAALLSLPPVAALAARPDDLALATQFRPHLWFDTAELWRPIDVEAFVAEPGHKSCVAHVKKCGDLQGGVLALTDLVVKLDLRGGADAHAPAIATCATSSRGILDCDMGPGRSPIYAHVTPNPFTGQVAIDYWWFLRYDAFKHVGDHEGDWEGVTVVLDPTATHVVETHFPAHDGVWRYPDGIASVRDGRVDVYVARGSHAAYPRTCAGGCKRTKGGVEGLLGEGRYDGRWPWTGNDTCQGCVKLLPTGPDGQPAGWDAWPGRWGKDRLKIPHVLDVGSPQSPGLQKRYRDPFAARFTPRAKF